MISGGLVRIQEGQPYFIKRGIAQLVERGFHTPRQPQVRTLLPRPSFAGLAKWEGNGSWPRHEAVRSRQPVRACSSSEERRIPNPRQRGFNSFLARQNRSARAQPVARRSTTSPLRSDRSGICQAILQKLDHCCAVGRDGQILQRWRYIVQRSTPGTASEVPTALAIRSAAALSDRPSALRRCQAQKSSASRMSMRFAPRPPLPKPAAKASLS